jgi:WD40 repeat protein
MVGQMKKTNDHIKQKPVIFLAFANDRVDDSAYLRNLPKEHRGIREALDKALKAGLCEVVERANSTVEDIMDVFQDARFRDRVAMFHYGGHADGYQLLLESLEGGRSAAYKEGLAHFLGGQKGLKFVFLNGCSTEQHAIELKRAGIPAVVGTSQSIDDETATNLSIRFYSGIANGSTIERAWSNAEDYIKTQKGAANFRDFYWQGKVEPEDRFPWDIFYKRGAENVKGWNLPEAVNDPLFGLPGIPGTYGLPESPFLYLERYQRKHARIFFGRSHDIRKLYNRINDPNSPPVILLYGQSGVGKSSLFEAGLMPRLEDSYELIYARRSEEKGLLGTLKEALRNHVGDMDDQPVEAVWRFIESETCKPLVVILDQAEEMYTRPNKKMPREFEDFLEALNAIFGNPALCPKGKLLLAYRKEYHPDIDKRMGLYELPRTWLFLEPMNRRGIMEVVTGLTRTDELSRRYRNIEVEENLPVIIADDLLEDKNSPIAPVLQIILTKMWYTALEGNSHNVQFTVLKYQELKKQGIAMEDFFKQQVAKLREWNPEGVDSGLALNVLKFHTTEFGTACTRSIEDIRTTYPHRRDIIDDLLQKSVDLYLLSNVEYGKKETSLAHDTLAPVVIKECTGSGKQGQRAARILAAKIEDFKKDESKVSLDDHDLEIVETGKNSMRVLGENEEKLLQISRERKAQRQRVRKRRITFLAVSIVLIIILSIVAVWQWSERQGNLRESESIRLAKQAGLKVKEDPTIALRIAEAAWKKDKNPTVTGAIYKIYRENNFYKTIAASGSEIYCAAISPDGNTVLTGSGDSSARLWDWRGKLIQEFKGHQSNVVSVAFSPGGNAILTGSEDGTARLWDLRGNTIKEFKGHDNYVMAVAFSSDGNSILTGSGDYTARLWDLRGNTLQEFKGHDAYVMAVAFSPDGKTILTGSEDKSARLWDRQGEMKKEFKGHTGSVTSVAFSPDGKTFLTGSEDNTARLWGLRGYPIRQFYGHAGSVTSVAFSLDGGFILTGSEDNTACLWDLRGNLLEQFKGHTGFVNSVAFSLDGNFILTASGDKTTRLWEWRARPVEIIPTYSFAIGSPDGKTILICITDKDVCLKDLEGKQIRIFKHDREIYSMAFSPDGKSILTASGDTVRLWDLRGKKINEFEQEFDVVSAAYSPDGKNILIASGEAAWLMDLEENTMQSFTHGRDVKSVAFSPDGNAILTGSIDSIARLWDLHGEEKPVLFIGHTGSVTSVDFSSDGHTILTGSGIDNTACFWDLRGNLIYKYKCPKNSHLKRAYFLPGETILTSFSDNSALIWKIPMPLEVFLKNGNVEPLSREQKKEYYIDD